MSQTQSSRRTFLRTVAQVFGVVSNGHNQGFQIPWSAGAEPPRAKAPPNAADCHHHIYDSRFPVDPLAKLRPRDATVAEYRLLLKRLGITRHVVVQPSTYGVDNRCLIDALRQFGRATSRGIAVVTPAVSDASLKEMQMAGVCGIRFNLVQAGATTLDMVEPLATRVAALGWHIQVNATAEQIRAALKMWPRLPVPVVFDHMGHISTVKDPALQAIRRLLQSGKCWVKLSGAYMDSKVGPPTYSDRSVVAKLFVKEVPERLVWGSDWPHPTASEKPDDALLFDLFADWAGSYDLLTKILVDNPASLYGFS